jgi:carotenoid cleavage dioxygenase-like enzyme
MTAHPKIDPETGEMIFFGYNQSRPYVHYGIVNPDGLMRQIIDINIPRSVMMHDFAITKNYSIFMDLPFFYNNVGLLRGEKIVSFDPTQKGRFGVLPRYATSDAEMKWFEIDACFIYHTLNAWEDGDNIVLFACRYPTVKFEFWEAALPGKDNNLAYTTKWILNMKTGEVTELKLNDIQVEFPKINERYLGRKCKYGYISLYHPELKYHEEAHSATGVYKLDLETNHITRLDYEDGREAGECVFVPRANSVDEDDGYLMTFTYHNHKKVSWVMKIMCHELTNMSRSRSSWLLMPDP